MVSKEIRSFMSMRAETYCSNTWICLFELASRYDIRSQV